MRFAQHFDRWFNSAELRALSDTVDVIDDLLLGELADRTASCGWAVLDAVSASSVRTPAESAPTPSNTTNAPDGPNSHAGPPSTRPPASISNYSSTNSYTTNSSHSSSPNSSATGTKKPPTSAPAPPKPSDPASPEPEHTSPPPPAAKISLAEARHVKASPVSEGSRPARRKASLTRGNAYAATNSALHGARVLWVKLALRHSNKCSIRKIGTLHRTSRRRQRLGFRRLHSSGGE